MSVEAVLVSILLTTVLLIIGKWIRRKVNLFRKLYLPSSIIAGTIALLAGPQILGQLPETDMFWSGGLWPEDVLAVWTALPGFLISIVFAGLFLGKRISPLPEIWQKAGPMIVHGQTLAWGQYVVGLVLVLAIIIPFWSISPLAGALIEIGFEGGHGTAAGLADTFRELGFEDGADMALGLATIGVVLGVLLGTVAINWGVWQGHLPTPGESNESDEDIAEHENREDTKEEDAVISDRAIEPLSVHVGLIGVAMGLGWLALKLLVWVENHWLVPLGWPELFRHVPLFPLAMIGGVVVQISSRYLGFESLIQRKLMNRITGTALDVLIVSALATLSLQAIGSNLGPFLILALGGVLWNVFGLVVLARIMFPKNWLTMGLANFGQGMGMTVVGLLLVRMSDPQNRTGTMEAFGYKQLMFEPIVGGGLFTAASLPLIYHFGAWPILTGVSIVMLAWLTFGLIYFRR